MPQLGTVTPPSSASTVPPVEVMSQNLSQCGRAIRATMPFPLPQRRTSTPPSHTLPCVRRSVTPLRGEKTRCGAAMRVRLKTTRYSSIRGRPSTKPTHRKFSSSRKRSPWCHSSSCKARSMITCCPRCRKNLPRPTEPPAASATIACSKIPFTNGLRNRVLRPTRRVRWSRNLSHASSRLDRVALLLSVSCCPHHEGQRLGHPRIARLRVGPGENNGGALRAAHLLDH